MPVVDFHLHAWELPFSAPEAFVRVLFGSDWPSVPTMKKNIETIRQLPLSQKAKEQILGGNAARILKLPG